MRRWFICKHHGSFISQIQHITDDNTWCPKCQRSKGEEKISTILNLRNIKYTPQKTFSNLLSNKNYRLKYDFYFTSTEDMCIIEFDGRQHFEDIEYFNKGTTFRERQDMDILKTEFCIKNNIRLLRIAYKQIDNISELIDDFLNNKTYIFSDNELYRDHVLLLK
jgi:very-short-patch-repair endonuclease